MKALDVARYLITLNDNECETKEEKNDLSKLKIQKLLYYTQGYYSALYDEYLFDEDIEARKYGPVVKKVYNEFKEIEGNFVPTDKYKMGKEEIEQIGENEKQLIEDVFNLMGQYSAWRLRDKTHQEDPWKNNYIKGKKNIKIPKDDIKKYFKRYVENE